MNNDDISYDELDPGIREVVRLFCTNGYVTSDSGDGESKQGTEQEGCMIDRPHVAIFTSPERLVETADKLLDLLHRQGVRSGPDEAMVTELAGPQPIGTEYGDGVMVEATYDPDNKTALVMVYGLNDTLLAECQQRVHLT